ncbi:maltase A1-like [Helicoverpa zea]|uniref:maltase A1-like n=1 Tax=Helicoverpa zea TaxID=7113 RepID=UPI001F5B0064|nr:maltase A1-like [Helicoverpa zea]
MVGLLLFEMLWVVLACVVSRVAADGVSPWWNNAVYYRMLVDSFRDGDGDGLGDLSGAIKQLSYIRALGADAVILSPIFAKSKECTKPGTMDFMEIDQRYGTMENFNALLEKAKKLELKVVVTLPLQTVSTASEWFTSSADRVPGYEHRIVWKDGTVLSPPPPELGIQTWTYHATRNTFFGNVNNEAVINLCCESVAAAFSAAQCAWLKRGVAGVLLNPDFPRDLACGEQLLKKLVADAMSCARAGNLDTPLILVESSLKPEQAARYYGDGGVGANSIISKALTYPSRSTNEMVVGFIASVVTTPMDVMPTWTTSAPNESRTASRYGSEMVDSVNLLALNLPGSAIIYQGDELAAADTILAWNSGTTCWPNQPAPWAAPFPWDDSPTAGFTKGEPWLPLAPNFRYANAKTEFSNELSHVGVMRIAAALRKSPAFGPHVEIKRQNGAVLVLRWGSVGSLLLISNLAKEPTEVDPSFIPGVPNQMTVATTSTGSNFAIATHLATDKTMKLAPGQTVLLAGGPRHCGGPGPVDKIASKLSEGWQKINKYFSS